MYAVPNQDVATTDLCEGAKGILEDADPIAWSRFAKKPGVDWHERLVRNARNLCRLRGSGAYGRRLVELGSVLRCSTRQGVLYFRLITNPTADDLAPQRRGRKRKYGAHA
jgi:hypothetical protein